MVNAFRFGVYLRPAIQDQKRDQTNRRALTGKKFKHEREKPAGNRCTGLRFNENVSRARAQEFRICGLNSRQQVVTAARQSEFILCVSVGLLVRSSDPLDLFYIGLQSID